MKYFITGGTGSLGKALIKRILESDIKNTVIVYSRDEGKQANSFKGNPRIKCVIGDVRDFHKLNTSMAIHRPDYVIHAAALKRVDDMEFYPDECVKTNVTGSENVANASMLNGVKKCMLVSTDKACQPVNVYGSSKFIAERIFTNCDYNSNGTIFASVRYGNVIASRGSFIPMWMGALNKGETIRITSPEMTRFLFTLGDAVDTVLNALYNCEGGEVFVPQINSYKITSVFEACKVLTNQAEAKGEIVGLRPGEKMHEDMLSKTELPYTYKVDDLNLLCIRPQYTNRNHNKTWERYDGLEFNSGLHVSDDLDQLVELVHRGVSET